jgi:hypothetical protein
MYFVGMPYLMRDWVGWVTSSPTRWNAAALGGATYGALVLVVALVAW